MAWTDQTPLTVGDLRAAMEGLPDDAQVFVEGDIDRPIVEYLHSEQIPHDNDDWQDGDPVVLGLELWLGGDEAFPAPRCQHKRTLDADEAPRGVPALGDRGPGPIGAPVMRREGRESAGVSEAPVEPSPCGTAGMHGHTYRRGGQVVHVPVGVRGIVEVSEAALHDLLTDAGFTREDEPA
jgi:hypothetical protein